MPFPEATSPRLFQLFPALSSLFLINICFTTNLLKGVVVPTSVLWPVLGIVALSPRAAALRGVRDVVLDVMHPHHHYGLLPPTFRLSPMLLHLEDWPEHDIDVKTFETFEPADVLQIFQSC
ncbi:hypothetical protein B0H12DRAFT_1155096 [Mycena haematopus]|nr:hypothetical protein B0H12DRAFT_1155096 [Mycena haematopus]